MKTCLAAMCQKLKQIGRELQALWKRRLATEAHKKLWADFEQILNIRATLWTTNGVLVNLIWFFSPNWTITKGYAFIADENSVCDRELVEALLPYLEVALIVLNVGRIILVALSFWKPGVCKYMIYYQLLYLAVRESVPNKDYTTMYMRLFIIHTYIFLSYNAWGEIFASLLCLGYVEVAVRHYVYLDERQVSELLLS